MKEHKVQVIAAIAKRLISLRGVAIGYPLPNGKWSLSDDHPGFKTSMCNQREHRYRITCTINAPRIGSFEKDVVVYAKGIGEAIAKADGWVSVHYPEWSCTFSGYRTGYFDPATAHEHGAILPESFFPSNA